MTPAGLEHRVKQLIDQRRFTELRPMLEDLLERYPQSPDLQITYAECLVGCNETELAKRVLKAVLSDYPESTAAHYVAVTLALAENIVTYALFHAQKVLDLAPDNPESHVLMGTVKMHAQDYKGALACAETALGIDSKHQGALNLYGGVGGYLREKRVPAVLEAALRNNPEDATALANSGTNLLQHGKTAEARDRLGRALALDPTDTYIQQNYWHAVKSRFRPYWWSLQLSTRITRLEPIFRVFLFVGIVGGMVLLYDVADQQLPPLAGILKVIALAGTIPLFLFWVMTPLSDFCLLFVREHRRRLPANLRAVALATGILFLVGIVSLAAYSFSPQRPFAMLAFLSMTLCFPLAVLAEVAVNGRRYQLVFGAVVVLFCAGLLGVIADNTAAVATVCVLTFYGQAAIRFLPSAD